MTTLQTFLWEIRNIDFVLQFQIVQSIFYEPTVSSQVNKSFISLMTDNYQSTDPILQPDND